MSPPSHTKFYENPFTVDAEKIDSKKFHKKTGNFKGGKIQYIIISVVKILYRF